VEDTQRILQEDNLEDTSVGHPGEHPPEEDLEDTEFDELEGTLGFPPRYPTKCPLGCPPGCPPRSPLRFRLEVSFGMSSRGVPQGV
jgi:hypothetical protein